MNIKILSSLENLAKERSNAIIIGTHNGIFHSDEVVGCAILSLVWSPNPVLIIRSRDEDVLHQCDLCVDIGGGKLDHHQAGFNETRKNGVKYASAGLVWKNYGMTLIQNMIKKYFPTTPCGFSDQSIFSSFDETCISLVDCEDNGVVTGKKHCCSFIPSFLPLWFEDSVDDFNTQFHKALLTTISVIEEELKSKIAQTFSANLVFNNWLNDNTFENGILEIQSQSMSWLESVIIINEEANEDVINFVIFPYPNGGWAAQCVPPSLEDRFNQRIPFPNNWAGETENLSKISGVTDATFCHKDRFFARSNSKEGIIKMCKIAIENLAI